MCRLTSRYSGDSLGRLGRQTRVQVSTGLSRPVGERPAGAACGYQERVCDGAGSGYAAGGPGEVHGVWCLRQGERPSAAAMDLVRLAIPRRVYKQAQAAGPSGRSTAWPLRR